MNRSVLWATLRNPLRPLLKRPDARRLLARITGRKFLHFLHIGKTGGSAVKFVLAGRPLGAGRVILLHEHDMTLDRIPAGEQVFFFLRNPVSRFASAFFSRQRQGLPRIFSRWTPDEAIAFQKFDSPNGLAEALSSDDGEIRGAAEHAMRSIRHINMSYSYWFRDDDYFRSRRDDIFFIGFQESLSADFATLMDRCGFPKRVRLPSDPVAAHRNPESLDRKLSQTAVKNLTQWYDADFRFIRICREFMAREQAAASAFEKDQVLNV